VPSNNVQKFRESLMMSKAELARKAGLSTLTIDRIEAGRPCRLDTKRKILLALGLRVSDKDRVFGPSADEPPQQLATRAAGAAPALTPDPFRRS
jgi:DNA-binding XRE family transcriptional regulator